MQIITKELNITAYQRNAISVITIKNVCHIVLNTGLEIEITCPDSRDAGNIKDTILYYPTENENAGKGFDFEFSIKILD